MQRLSNEQLLLLAILHPEQQDAVDAELDRRAKGE
jgi:hypothetical protein